MGITSQNLNAQTQQDELTFGDMPKPVPSVSSLSTYINTPTSLATGIPEISFPIAKLSAAGPGKELGVVLSYHAGNVSESEAAGEVGAGWTLMGGGVISREIMGELDERFDDTATGNYQVNTFDDIYYYNFPGGFGKFKINRNIQNNTFSIENLSPNKIKFEYTRSSNTATLILTSFTLTDERGYKYFFNDYWVATRPAYLTTRKEYKSAFFLSKIVDPNNVEVANFTYQKDDRYIPNTSKLSYRSCKLKSITSMNIGSIVIDYNYENLEGTINDPYSITGVSLKNNTGMLIEKYLFEYGFGSYGSGTSLKRILMSIKKTDKNSVVIEKTGFVYDSDGSGTVYNPDPNYPYGDYLCAGVADPKNRTLGILKWVNLPSGGRIEYNYEANQVFIDKNSSSYLQTINESQFADPEIQYIKPYSEMNIDTNQGTSYIFNVTTSSPEKRFYIDFQIEELYQGGILDPGTGELYLNYTIKKNGQQYTGAYCGGVNPNILMYSLPPGGYTIQIYGTGGKAKIVTYEIANIPPPFKNVTTSGAEGIRIRSIKKYENIYLGQPQHTTEYDYSDFANPATSSGYVFSNEDMGNSNAIYLPYVLYKNVKVKENENGYIKYYFKTPSDYPFLNLSDNTVDPNYLPFYNLTKKGILDKMEAYDSQNRLVNSKAFEYVFEAVANSPEYVIYGGVKSWPSWIKSDKVTERLYEAGTQNFTENKIENSYSSSNYEQVSSKKTSHDGTITEKLMKYAIDKGNTTLINANMLSIPLEIESKSNGKTIGKVETKFATSSLLLPTSKVAINPNDNSQKTLVRYDYYDSKGNPLQYTVDIDTNGNGNSVVVIWGYNQTLPIAKIEGAKISDIGNISDDIIAKSNIDIDNASETNLINALDAFRSNPALKSFVITTYTYDPLIGITTVTPPNGMREIYKYDSSNRLKAVVDVNGNIIKDYKYNKKLQP